MCSAVLAAALLLLAGCGSAPVKLEGPPETDSQREENARAEIASLGEYPWAGEYTSGPNTVGMFVVLSPREGVLEGGWSCLQSRSPHYLGEIGDVSEHMITIAADGRSDEKLERLGGCLVRFRWGERRYLAWPFQVAEAERHLNGGHMLSADYGLFMLHADDAEKAQGTPEEFERIVRDLCGEASIWAFRSAATRGRGGGR
jgi:hypothetical protein